MEPTRAALARRHHLPQSGHTVQSYDWPSTIPQQPLVQIIHVGLATHTHTHTHSHSRTPARRHTGRDVRIGRSRGSPAFRFCLAWRIIIFYQEMSSRRLTLAEGSSNRGQSCFSVLLERTLSLPLSLFLLPLLCYRDSFYCSCRVRRAARNARGKSRAQRGKGVLPPERFLFEKKKTHWTRTYPGLINTVSVKFSAVETGESIISFLQRPHFAHFTCALFWQPRAPCRLDIVSSNLSRLVYVPLFFK